MCPRRSFARIQIEDHAIWVANVPRQCVPGMKLDDVELRSSDQRLRVIDLEQSLVTGPQRGIESFDPWDTDLLSMLLEEELTGDAGRPSDQRAGSPLQVRQDPIRNRLVVANQIQLGEPRAGIDNAITMADLDPGALSAAQRYTSSDSLGRFAANDFCRLVAAQGDI